MNRDKQQAAPPVLSGDELRLKLARLKEILAASGYEAIVLSSEGAMRWLTGLKHQLGDIAPPALSPVQALVRVAGSDAFEITIFSKPFEMPRLKDEIPAVFEPVPEIKFNFSDTPLSPAASVLTPDLPAYPGVLDQIIRPLPGGLEGDSFKKLAWLSRTAMQSLAETAVQLKAGMEGLAVRGLMLNHLAARGVDANLVLIALAGQELHLHPIASPRYRVEPGRWMKLVVGARYAEHIVSQTLMVKLGGEVTDRETQVYHALQQATVEYADLYREGAVEREIYSAMKERFAEVERDAGLSGFGASATLHHPGGGTSPLGNRDRMLNPQGQLVCEPWTQFAINPVDALCGLKVELQGIIQPGGAPPVLLDMYSSCPQVPTRTVCSRRGTKAQLAELWII